MFIYDLSFFLTSTAFVPTNAKYGIPLSRYTVFFENCPLGDAPIPLQFFCKQAVFSRLFYFALSFIISIPRSIVARSIAPTARATRYPSSSIKNVEGKLVI